MFERTYSIEMDFSDRKKYYQQFQMLSDGARERIFKVFGKVPPQDQYLEGREIMLLLSGSRGLSVAAQIDMVYKLEQQERDLISMAQQRRGNA